jgi:hypothetical protein
MGIKYLDQLGKIRERTCQDGLLPARQVCAGAPYAIREDDLARPAIRQAIAKGRSVSSDPRQENLSFQ